MNITPQKGRGIIITGKPGAGKTSLAIEIAQKYGTYTQADENILHHEFALAKTLAQGTKSIIVNVATLNYKNIAKAKALVTADKIELNIKHQQPREVAAPYFIFCTTHFDPLKLGGDERRFLIIDL